MAETIQTAKVSCRGGLDLRSTTQDLLSKPGQSTTLENFEQNIGGGYRRINGYTDVGSTVTGTGDVTGAFVYNNGFVACRGDAIYFSFDGTTWIQVNKDLAAGGDLTALNAAAALPRTNADNYSFDTFTQGGAGSPTLLLIHDEANKPAVLIIEGTSSVTATFTYREITSGSILDGEWGLVHNDQHIIAGVTANPSAIYVSNVADMEDFTTGLSGLYSVADPIVGIKPFRDVLYIFCENSIWKATGLNQGTSGANIQPVTKDIGCVSGDTIQEIGGDLVFLAHDGLRSLGATDRIDDVNLNTISLPIGDFFTTEILSKLDRMEFKSVVLRNKSQYRLYFKDMVTPNAEALGIIATYYPDPTSQTTWSFSTTKGIRTTSIGTGFIDKIERTVHGDETGKLFFHDEGLTFDSTPIEFDFITPYFDLGDPGIRKALKTIQLYTKPEGIINDLRMGLRFEYEDPEVIQPTESILTSLTGPASFDFATFDTAIYVFDARELPVERIYVQGSSHVISLRFRGTELAAPFTIQGFNINFTVSGRI